MLIIIVPLVFLAICLICLAFMFGTLYGLDGAPNFREWVKERIRLNRKENQEFKAKKQYLKANPLCTVCMQEGKFVKATQVWQETNGNLQPRCDKHAESERIE